MNPEIFSTITFPSLGISWNPGRYFEIGPVTIRYYGLIIALGLLLAVIYACRRSSQFGISVEDLTDGVLFIVPFAIICARLYFCVFSWDQYAANPISILYIWKGGLAIYGGVIGAAIGIVVFSLVKKIRVGAVLDITALGFLIGQSIGRWGNFFNREAFGAETETFLRMGLTNRFTGEVTYFHPTFLYESVWNLCGFVLLHFLSKKRKYDGQIALGYLVWYGLGRTFIEGLRMDSLMLGSVRVSQILAAVTCLLGAAVLMVMAFLPHDPQNMQSARYARKLAEAAEAAAAVEAAEETDSPTETDEAE